MLTKCGLRFLPRWHISYKWDHHIPPIICKCLLNVLCPVSRPITTLDCILLKDNIRAPIARKGPEINFRFLVPCIFYRLQINVPTDATNFISISYVSSHPTCFGPLLAHHQGCPELLLCYHLALALLVDCPASMEVALPY
jgi:hypothetical protein